MNNSVATTEKTEIQEPAKSIKQWVQTKSFQERLEGSTGSRALVKKYTSSVLLEVARNPQLEKCTPQSFMECVVDSANFGLIPNKLSGQAYLIPYNKSYKKNGKWLKVLECTLQIGYKGYITKFAEAGWIVEVEMVSTFEQENGYFKEVRGSNPYIEHTPIRDGTIKNRDNLALVYAVARHSTLPPIYAVMSKEEIEEVVKYEDAHEKGTWKANTRETDYAEMCKKTAIRRLAKTCPISIVNEISSYEGEAEQRVMTDVTPQTHNKADIWNEPQKQPGDGATDVTPPKKENAPQEKTDDKKPELGGELYFTIIDGKQKEFDDLGYAVNYLVKIMKSHKTKAARLKLNMENESLVFACTDAKDAALAKKMSDCVEAGADEEVVDSVS